MIREYHSDEELISLLIDAELNIMIINLKDKAHADTEFGKWNEIHYSQTTIMVTKTAQNQKVILLYMSSYRSFHVSEDSKDSP